MEISGPGDLEPATGEMETSRLPFSIAALAPAEMTVHWADLALSQTPANVRDLWAHRDVAVSGAAHKVTVPSHSVVLWRVH